MAIGDVPLKSLADGRPKRLLIVSQVYVPDSAAVGQCVADAADEMARRGWEVVVFTSARGYDDPSVRYPRREIRNGVRIRRLPLSSFGKRSIAIRLFAQFIFIVQALVGGLCLGKLDAVLVSTSPPFSGFFGAIISRLRSSPLVWWVMDLNPDQMIAAGKLGPRSLPVRIFDWMNLVTLRHATKIVVLDDYMRRRVEQKLDVAEDRIHVIPPWTPAEPEHVETGADESFRRRHGLENAFVIMYAGNHALQHPLDTLLDAAGKFEGDSRIVFVFAGGGAGKARVEARLAAGAKNIRSLPYQPLETLPATLAAADMHVVSMGNDMVGIVHPCKIYGAMAVGRPILYFGASESHAGRLVDPQGLGWRVAHGDVQGAIAAIREASAMSPGQLDAIGRRGAALAKESFSRGSLIAAVCDVIEHASSSGSEELS
jgi:colanic acid biosynthesis glycosyl transferase WcaI